MQTPEVSAEAASQQATVLFVDDEANILSSLNRLFRPEGYRIFTANGGAKGLEVLEKEQVDLVISDMRMPEMDGAAFLEQVAKRWPHVVRLLLTGYSDINSTIAAVNKGSIYRYLQKPWEENDLKLTVRHALQGKYLERERARLEELTQKQNSELKELNSGLEAKVAARTQDLRKMMDRVQAANDTLKKSYVSTIKVFASVAEMREGGTGGHSRRVAAQARALALELGMSEADAQNVLFAALLHDIGKIGLPDNLVDKPFNTLVAEERVQVVKHPAIGESLLMALEPLQEAAKLIRAHHERTDGKGYPDGLSGDQIPLGARVLAVASDYDALQNGLIAPERMTPAQAQKFIQENRGQRYDARVVDAFVQLLGKEQQQAQTSAEVRTRTAALKPGMVLTRDLLSKERVLLLPQGHVLDAAVIAKIKNLESAGDELVLYVRQAA